jgi:hypothetical protein
MGNEIIIEAVMKAMMFREALASSQMEGIGKKITVGDMYFYEHSKTCQEVRRNISRI